MKKEIYQQFKGMSAEIREFLIQLGENNTKVWFDAHRDLADSGRAGPPPRFSGHAPGVLGSGDGRVRSAVGRTRNRPV